MKPADPRDIRRHNLSLVLREVADRGPRSRATIALDTGLNKSTVSSLVAELEELGLVRESGQERPGAVGPARPERRARPERAVSFSGSSWASTTWRCGPPTSAARSYTARS